MDVSQSSQIGKGRNKRFWTKEEEWALVHGLLELSIDPQWKAEGNFKGGCLVKLEEVMTAKCPRSGTLILIQRPNGLETSIMC